MKTLTFQDIVKEYQDLSSYDIQVYISYIFDIPQSQVIFKEYCQNEIKLIQDVLNRVKKSEPLQYILNKAYFFARKFYVNKSVLIPRFDTEILVEQAIKIIKNNKFRSCLDLCTGSGIIGITVSLETGVKTVCADISSEALNVAQINAKNLKANINCIHSDLFKNICEKFDIIVSNPPYIPTKDIQQLDKMVKDFEPHLALDGKQDGLYFYEQIIKNAKMHLNKGGVICFEVGINQSQQIAEMLKKDFKNVKIIKDYNNIERVVIGELC